MQTSSTVTTTILQQTEQLAESYSIIWNIIIPVVSTCVVITITKLIEWRRKPAFTVGLDFTAMRTFDIEVRETETKVLGRAKFFRLRGG